MTIQPWEERVNDMDVGMGVSNKLIQFCMKEEIKDLRKALRDQDKTIEKALKAQRRKLTTQIERQKKRIVQAKQRASEWRAHAARYQKLAAAR